MTYKEKKQKANEFAKEFCKKCIQKNDCGGLCTTIQCREDSFMHGLLVGLEEAKIKWHDSENDFPPNMSDTGRFSINVWSSKKEVVYYDHVEQVWMSFDSDEVTSVTAWIEIPVYEL